MEFRCMSLAAAVGLGFSPLAAIAQVDAPPSISISAASAAPAGKSGPRLMTPAESRNSASPPGDLRPERPVTPQVKIPFGKAPPAPSQTPSRATRPGSAASAGGIDDAAVRCEAEPDARSRATCRGKLAREAGSR